MLLLSLKRLAMLKMLFVVVMAMILMGTVCGLSLHMAGVVTHHQMIVMAAVVAAAAVVSVVEECPDVLIFEC